jgi:hypothetical protein
VEAVVVNPFLRVVLESALLVPLMSTSSNRFWVFSMGKSSGPQLEAQISGGIELSMPDPTLFME